MRIKIKKTLQIKAVNRIRLIQICLSFGCLVLLVVSLFQIFIPVSVSDNDFGVISPVAFKETVREFDKVDLANSLPKAYRDGLFAPAIPLRNNSVTDKQISSILSNYEIKYITALDNQWCVYIKDKNKNTVSKMVVNDTNGVFSVISILPSAIDIMIMDQKVTLTK